MLHTCDNPWCVTPDHLWLGTHAENQIDKVKKMRHQHGERVHTAKLTEEQVLVIRNEEGSCEALGRKYGVYGTTIKKIKDRLSWKHL